MAKNYFYLLLFLIIAFASDQFSKYYVTQILAMNEGEFRAVIHPIFNLQYVKNFGINFGLFGQGSGASRWILVGITTAIAVAVLWWAHSSMTRAVAICAGLLIGGALGNIFDRVFIGSVIDFINNSWYGFRNPFSYNLADVWIFGGMIGLFIWGPKEK